MDGRKENGMETYELEEQERAQETALAIHDETSGRDATFAVATDTPTDEEIVHAAFGRTAGPTEDECCRRIAAALAVDYPDFVADRAYAEYRVGVCVFGWDWEGYDR